MSVTFLSHQYIYLVGLVHYIICKQKMMFENSINELKHGHEYEALPGYGPYEKPKIDFGWPYVACYMYIIYVPK